MTPAQVEQSIIDSMWNRFNNQAVHPQDGKVTLSFSGRLEGTEGVAIKKFIAQLKEKGWNVDSRQITHSWLTRIFVYMDTSTAMKYDVELTITPGQQV
jgi:hypothetical protein